jgi:hypothetical protein
MNYSALIKAEETALQYLNGHEKTAVDTLARNKECNSIKGGLDTR